jgi:translation elongation factor EF-1alpha
MKGVNLTKNECAELKTWYDGATIVDQLGMYLH